MLVKYTRRFCDMYKVENGDRYLIRKKKWQLR